MTSSLRADRKILHLICQATIGAAAALAALPAGAQSKVVMVEEHWELQVADPDSGSTAPQVGMVMSPTADSEDTFFAFTINHIDAPVYEAGGLQVEHWDGDDLVDYTSSPEHGTLSNANEVVSWVQRMELNNGQLTFGIHNGASETWGAFGGTDLSIAASTSLTELNAYRPAVSLSESQVGYAENRVASLILTKLVWVTDDGQVHEQDAPIPLDTSLDQ